MTLLLLALLLGTLSAAWVVLPIVRRRLAAMADPLPHGVVDAQARRRVALASLKEVEYDRIGGKLDDEDYERLKAQLEREALEAIQAADATAFTHACGFVNPVGSRFCAGCGARL